MSNLNKVKQPIKVLVNTITPDNSLSDPDYGIVINTDSPGSSATPHPDFGKITINSESPDTSLTPANVTLHDGVTLNIENDMLEVLDLQNPECLETINSINIDTFITGCLLTEEELLNIDARTLLSIKYSILSELSTNETIKNILRKYIEQFIKS